MNFVFDRQLVWFFAGVLAFLVIATVVGRVLAHRASDTARRATLANLNARINAWWAMVAVFAVAILGGRTGALVPFGLISFLALREFVALAPTRRADHRTLFYGFFAGFPCNTTSCRSNGTACSAS
jgi:phosphatidate cytidylyltransferase